MGLSGDEKIALMIDWMKEAADEDDIDKLFAYLFPPHLQDGDDHCHYRAHVRLRIGNDPDELYEDEAEKGGA